MYQVVEQYTITNNNELKSFKDEFIKKGGKVDQLFECFQSLDILDKKKIGQPLNHLKQYTIEKFKKAAAFLQSDVSNKKHEEDITLPAYITLGGVHPLTILRDRIIKIMKAIGFGYVDGPEIDSDENNFTLLNFPKDHPARDMQDTFFLPEQKGISYLLRTHTSNTQIHQLKKGVLPIQYITIGRVFRNETISSRTHCMFHQIEGVCVDKKVTLIVLKATIKYLLQEIFEHSVQLRFRSSYFPFTTPSLEVDISCVFCNQKGCKICKQSGWLEVGGLGMIDPTVLNHCNIESKHNGFAFGLGLERIALLYYRIDDIRLFTENTLPFLNQFKY